MTRSYTRLTLRNRMKVLLVPMSGTQTTSLFVFCKIGSRNERKNINGASHFLEHLMFKGTKRRPSTLLLSQELEGMGAEFNAFTGKDYTGYYIKAPAKHTKQSVDILHDMLFQSVFNPHEIERERNVIIQEIKMYEENPMMHIEDLHEQAVFANSTLGWSIAGPAKTIAQVPRKDLLVYKKEFYHPANMICVVAGNIRPSVKKIVNDYFGKEKSGRVRFAEPPHARFISNSFLVQTKKTQQAQLAIGYRGLDHNHADMPALELLSSILGGSMSSRLFIQVRERLGLCYYIKSDVTAYADTGTFSIYAGVASNKVQKAVQSIKKEVEKMRTELVTQEELARAKEYLKGKMIIRMEASEKQAQWYAQEELFMDTVHTPDEWLKEIDAVTAKDILQVAKKVLKPKSESGACVGPFTRPQFTKLFDS